MKKITAVLVMLIITSLALIACGPAAGPEGAAAFSDVCLVTDSAGIGDKSFNDAVWMGLESAMSDFGIEANYIESKSADDYGPNLEACVDSEPDMIVCVGFMMGDACQVSVEANPDIYYIGIDISWLTYDNFLGVDAYMDQSSFQAGYLSAGMTETGVVAAYTGFFGPAVQIFLDGYWAGVQEYNKVHGTDVKVLGYDPDDMENATATGSWIDVDLGRQVTESFMDNGADIVYPVCGNVGTGSAAVMAERGLGYIFGMDQDWTITQPPEVQKYVLASALKKMEVPVYNSIKSLVEDGTWMGGKNYVLQFENGGTELAYNSAIEIPADLKAETDALKDKIQAGELPSLSPQFLAVMDPPRE